MDEVSGMTVVLDDEHVLRSIPDDPQLFDCDGAGSLVRLSNSAFNDRNMRPSVDRACMHCKAGDARRLPAAGVVSLHVARVRTVRGIVTNDSKGMQKHTHDVDVLHDPIEGNAAHALVVTAPGICSTNTFRRLKEALCLLAQAGGWVVRPGSRGG